MSSKDLRFRHAMVGEETIACFLVCPVLANQRDALAGALGEMLEEFSEPLIESDVSELPAGEFATNPCLGSGGGGVINPR